MATDLKHRVTELYTGSSQTSAVFRYVLIFFDFATILFFIATAPLDLSASIVLISRLLGLIIFVDFAARIWISEDRAALIRKPYMIADIVVLASLVINPLLHVDLRFLRILRGLRLIHSYHLLRDLRRHSIFFRHHEDAIIAGTNLLVFVFVTTSMVYELFFRIEGNPLSYVDALYFTVATLTTTGFGDITLVTPAGKLLSVFIMVVGVALFVQLAKAIFSPSKIKHGCSTCGLTRHDIDAVHCKHCGETLKIETSGLT